MRTFADQRNRDAGFGASALVPAAVSRWPQQRTHGGSSSAEHEAEAASEEIAAGGTAGTATATPSSAGRAPSVAREALARDGEPLDHQTRISMEARFGHDFSKVRVHTDAGASASAAALGAEAYTSGPHIAFERNRYAPHSTAGRALLAHELTHVVQQNGAAPGTFVQLKPKAIRFQEEPTLEEISDGKKVLKETDKGEAVVRVTIALHELGHYTISAIDQSFDPPLTSAVTRYQDAKGLKGKAAAGAVDKPTFDALDTDFSAGHKVELDVLSKQKSPALLAGTQTVDADERTAANRAMSTEIVATAAKPLPTFVDPLPLKGFYEDRLRDITEKVIVAQYNAMGKGKAAEHAAPGKLFDWPLVEGIALESQKAVDGIFGEYTKAKAPPPLKKNVNIFDAWDAKVKELTAGGKPKEDSSAEWRVSKILSGHEFVKALDLEHGAIQSRAAEKKIVDKVRGELATKYRTELIETHKGWPGFADTDKGQIFIQRFKGADDDANRAKMWRFYQTFIHEYIHTLEHGDYKKHRTSLAEQKGGFTLREGTTEYFTKIVWDSITVDAALQKKIEGPYHDATKAPVKPSYGGYGEARNAERLAGVVGLRNLAAAFFLGKLELIGKP